jgi:hypothetical protein
MARSVTQSVSEVSDVAEKNGKNKISAKDRITEQASKMN